MTEETIFRFMCTIEECAVRMYEGTADERRCIFRTHDGKKPHCDRIRADRNAECCHEAITVKYSLEHYDEVKNRERNINNWVKMDPKDPVWKDVPIATLDEVKTRFIRGMSSCFIRLSEAETQFMGDVENAKDIRDLMLAKVTYLRSLAAAIPRHVNQCPFCLMYRRDTAACCSFCPYGKVFKVCTEDDPSGSFKKYVSAAQAFTDSIDGYYDDRLMNGLC